MRATFFKFLIGISLLNISLAANVCVKEGDSPGNYPGAASCCKGLDLQSPPPGNYGSAGTCVKKNNCIKEGDSVGNASGSAACCKGLVVEVYSTTNSTTRRCVKEVTCIEEGGSLADYPGALGCCVGLEKGPPHVNDTVSLGTCVQGKSAPSSINDSRIQSKDPSSGAPTAPSKESKVMKQ